jgi:hypothetical protein
MESENFQPKKKKNKKRHELREEATFNRNAKPLGRLFAS